MKPINRPFVTVICGFLGAGKTTLLRHLLAQAEGRRWAAVVNDVAALNIDGALVRDAGQGIDFGGNANSKAGAADVIELENGCVCCSSGDELAETIAELAAGGRGGGGYEHIWVETTGVAEPRGIANLFTRKNPFGRTLGDFSTLSALVSVIDAAAFWKAAKGEEGREKTERGAKASTSGGARPVFELMLEQVECADVLVLNQCDRVDGETAERVEAILRGLNPRAEVVRTERGQVGSEFLLGRARFDAKATVGAARWVRELNAAAATPVSAGGWVKKSVPSGGAPYHETKYGITSVVFQERRPFERERLRAWLEAGWPGLLRAKGFYWTREEPDEMGFLSVAGGAVRHETLNPWWAALVENGRASAGEVPATVRALWAEPHGDRRQELVFIGVELDEAALRAGLAGCLAE